MTTKQEPSHAVLTLEVQALCAEVLADLLRSNFGVEPVEIVRPGDPKLFLESYFDSEVEALLVASVLKGREGISSSSIRMVADRDWSTFWRHHFRTLDIGQHLRIRPVWEEPLEDEGGRLTLVMNPGMSFGTGNHFTTRFCLERLEDLCQNERDLSVLDVGTGSGILAIAAYKLGCKQVLAMDVDEQALHYAKENAELNGVLDVIHWDVADITRQAALGPYDVVCANLFSDLLVDVAPILMRSAASALVLSGIRDSQVDSVAEAYLALGARQVQCDGDGEWAGIVFKMGASS